MILGKFDLIKCELDHYKRQQVADLDDDPLEWWKSNHTHYPMMAGSCGHYLPPVLDMKRCFQ